MPLHHPGPSPGWSPSPTGEEGVAAPTAVLVPRPPWMRIVAALPLLLAACTPAPTPRPATAKPTIVSLNPCTDAILAEVADPAQLLAISSYSHDPASSSLDPAVARRFAATRGTVEEVTQLRPDLVIDGNFTAPATRDAFVRLGLRLEQVAIAPTVEASVAQVRQLAALAGHPARGDALARRIEAAVAANASADKIPAIVWQSGGIVAGQGTLIDDLLRRTGFSNAAAARGLATSQLLAAGTYARQSAARDPGGGQRHFKRRPAVASSGLGGPARFAASAT